jgi:hypothetical protein
MLGSIPLIHYQVFAGKTRELIIGFPKRVRALCKENGSLRALGERVYFTQTWALDVGF